VTLQEPSEIAIMVPCIIAWAILKLFGRNQGLLEPVHGLIRIGDQVADNIYFPLAFIIGDALRLCGSYTIILQMSSAYLDAAMLIFMRLVMWHGNVNI